MHLKKLALFGAISATLLCAQENDYWEKGDYNAVEVNTFLEADRANRSSRYPFYSNPQWVNYEEKVTKELDYQNGVSIIDGMNDQVSGAHTEPSGVRKGDLRLTPQKYITHLGQPVAGSNWAKDVSYSYAADAAYFIDFTGLVRSIDLSGNIAGEIVGENYADVMGAHSIDVDKNGTPWVVNDGDLFKLEGDQWVKVYASPGAWFRVHSVASSGIKTFVTIYWYVSGMPFTASGVYELDEDGEPKGLGAKMGCDIDSDYNYYREAAFYMTYHPYESYRMLGYYNITTGTDIIVDGACSALGCVAMENPIY